MKKERLLELAGVNEAIKTKCQTSDVIFNTDIKSKKIGIELLLPFELDLTDEEAKILEANLHNALELVLAKYFYKK